ncbi:MAG TPA: hypothetical protein VNN73_23020 [Blastocatellia bacterium]|nr:hypothetical protein [Blastocatellia bacterium]
MKRYLSRINIVLVGIALLGLTSFTAQAATRPFHLVEQGTLQFLDGGVVVSNGTGTATHLGQFTLRRTLTLSPSEDGSSNLEARGQASIVAANGDHLEASIVGTVDPNTGTGILVYEWEGGTGRFEKATGTTIWRVTLHPADGTYDVIADGVINY